MQRLCGVLDSLYGCENKTRVFATGSPTDLTRIFGGYDKFLGWATRLGLVNPLLAAAALGVVGPESSGMAAGSNNTFRQLGAAFGVAGLGAVLQGAPARASAAGANPTQAFVDGFNEVLLFGAAIAFVGA